MSTSFRLGSDRFDAWNHNDGRLFLMHHERTDERSSHSVGNAFATEDALMAAARDHIAMVEDTGNCRGEIHVRLRSLGRAHIARLGTTRTRCGRDLPVLAEYLRATIVDKSEICGGCLRAY